MAWYSLLPPHLTAYETWIIRGFLVLAIINIAPWIIAILYDLVYYVGRIVWHEIPIWGGRARGERRPRAPSLRDRNRRLSFAEMISTAGRSGSPATAAGSVNTDAVRSTSRDERERELYADTATDAAILRHRKTLSRDSIKEEEDDDT